jgi:hypothetical protein
MAGPRTRSQTLSGVLIDVPFLANQPVDTGSPRYRVRRGHLSRARLVDVRSERADAQLLDRMMPFGKTFATGPRAIVDGLFGA